jgi:hypothetical protein
MPHPAFQQPLPASGSDATEWALDTLFGVHKPEAWIAAVTDPDKAGDWQGSRYKALANSPMVIDPDAGHYVCIALLVPGEARHAENVEAVTCAVLDDVGKLGLPNTKLDEDLLELLPEPTFTVETSLGNSQVFFAFDPPASAAAYERFADDLKRSAYGGGIRDGTSLVRYVRLPSGKNPKPGRGKFETRLTQATGEKFSLEELRQAFGLGAGTGTGTAGSATPKGANTKSDDAIPEALLLPEDEALALVKEIMALIPNKGVGREDWIGIAFAIWNASGENEDSYDVFLSWTATRVEKGVDPDKDTKDVWDHRLGTKAGVQTLIKHLGFQQTPAANAMIEKVKQIQARSGGVFEALPGDNSGDNSAGMGMAGTATVTAKEKDRWKLLREATNSWPSRDKVVNAGGDGNVARRDGFAVFGKGAKSGPAQARPYITNRHARGLVSVLQGIPGKGKTAVAVATMNTIASEKPGLVGLSEVLRCGASVYMAADSEKADEFKRRDEAFRQRHGLTDADFRHNIYVVDEPGAFLEKLPGDVWAPSLWMIAQAKVLAELREKEKLAVIVADTLGGMSGGGKLNDEADMRAVMRVAQTLAYGLNCSVDLINHLTKGGAKTDQESMDAGSGARSLTATPRFVTNVIEEGSDMIKLFSAKGSYRDGPRGMEILQWVSEAIPVEVWDEGVLTGTDMASIGVLVPVNPLVLAQGREDIAVTAIEDAIRDGAMVIRTQIARGGRPGKDHAGVIVREATGLPQVAAEELVSRLIEQGRLVATSRYDAKRKGSVDVITVDGEGNGL